MNAGLILMILIKRVLYLETIKPNPFCENDILIRIKFSMHKIIILLFAFLLFSCGINHSSDKRGDLSFNWELLDSINNTSFRGISVPDEKTVWVTGSGGTFMRTVNGGETWYSDTIPGYGNIDFRDVEAFDSLTAIVMGIANPAVILRTEDGGNTWEKVFYKKLDGIFLNSMVFLDKKNGFLVGDPIDGRFYLLKTTNGGKSWEELPKSSCPLAENGEYMFAASGSCISGMHPSRIWFVSGGSMARVFYSVDNGIHWEVVNTPIMSGLQSTGIFSVLFTDQEKGFCIGGDYSKPDSTGITFIFTRDGGLSWQQAKNMPAGYRSCIKQLLIDGKSVIIAVGRGGCGYLEDPDNLEAHWKQISPLGFYTLDVDPAGKVAWAAGANGRLGKLNVKIGSE